VRVDNRLDPVDAPAIELAVYRIVQEGLTNVLRHAGPQAQVDLGVRHESDEIIIDLADDGQGSDGRGGDGREGHGLTGMRERVAVHGGTFHAGPLPTGGWQVRATIPIPSAVRVPGAVPA